MDSDEAGFICMEAFSTVTIPCSFWAHQGPHGRRHCEFTLGRHVLSDITQDGWGQLVRIDVSVQGPGLQLVAGGTV